MHGRRRCGGLQQQTSSDVNIRCQHIGQLLPAQLLAHNQQLLQLHRRLQLTPAYHALQADRSGVHLRQQQQQDNISSLVYEHTCRPSATRRASTAAVAFKIVTAHMACSSVAAGSTFRSSTALEFSSSCSCSSSSQCQVHPRQQHQPFTCSALLQASAAGQPASPGRGLIPPLFQMPTGSTHTGSSSSSLLKSRPAVTPAALRELIQQQIDQASSWQQLQQLLQGRKAQLTLKHISLMAVKVARLQLAAQEVHLKQQHRQLRLNAQSNGGSRGAALAPHVVPAAAAQLQPFLEELAAAAQEAVVVGVSAQQQHQQQQGKQSMEKSAAQGLHSTNSSSSSNANSSSSSANSGSSSPSPRPPGSVARGFIHPPGPLSGYLAGLLWGFTKLEFPLAADQLQTWVEAFAAVAAAADEVSLSQVVWALGHLQYWPGDDVMQALSAEVSRRVPQPSQSQWQTPPPPPPLLQQHQHHHHQQQQHVQDQQQQQEQQRQQQHVQDQQRQQQGQQLVAPDHNQAAAVGNGSSTAVVGEAAPASAAAAADDDDEAKVLTVHKSLGPRALCNFLGGCALLGFKPPSEVLDRVWAGSACDLATAAPQALCNMLWAAVSLGVFPREEWMRAWAVATESSKERWSSADFGTAIWAVGKLAGSSAGRVLLPDLPWRLTMMKACKRVLPAAEPRELTCTAWGFTAMGLSFSLTFTEKLLASTFEARLHFKAREWAVLLAVLAKQGVTPEPFWQRSCHLVLQQRLKFMTAQDFAMSLWGICQLGVPPRDLWRDRFFTDSYSQLFFLTASCCCRLVWSLGQLRWLAPQEWSDRLFLETYAKLSSFKAPELAGTFHGLARLELRPPVQWMWQATAVMAVAAPEMTPQEVTTCLWALSKMQYQPPRQWLDALAARAAALLPAAWRPQDPHHSAASSSRRPHPRKLTIMGREVAATQETHELYHQMVSDRSAAAARRQRQELQQQLQERLLLQQQGQQLSRQRWQPRQQHSRGADLLQLRGDMGLLGSRLARPLESSADDAAGDAAAGAAALLPHVPVRQRCLGAGDLQVVLVACFRLQHHLPRSHPLMAAAQQLINEHPKLQEIKEMIISMESFGKSSTAQPALASDTSGSSAVAVNSDAGSSRGDVFNAGERPRPRFSRGRRGRLGLPKPGGVMIDNDAGGFAVLE